MAIYNSQAEASERIPQQWRAFRLTHSAPGSSSRFYGASPCTGDRKIHYLTGIAQQTPEIVVDSERLTLEAGEYAVVRVNDTALLRDTWIWLLESWLPTSGRREKNAPEFERFTRSRRPAHPLDRSKSGFLLNNQILRRNGADQSGKSSALPALRTC